MRGSACRWGLIAVTAVGAFAAGTWWAMSPARPAPEEAEAVHRPPQISPDFAGIVMPPNIAPLNFVVREEGRRFFVQIRGEAGEGIEVASRGPAIEIPPGRWRPFLESNRGKDLQWDVYAEVDRKWRRYEPLVNRVAEDEIDGHLVYRLITPVHSKYGEVSIHQRNLASYEESPLIAGESIGDTCVNCHSFAANNPGRMLLGMRSPAFGKVTFLAEGGHVTKLAKPFGYTAWHPSGRMAAYSTNKVRQFFHFAGAEVRDVVDLASAMAYFRLDGRESKNVPGASDQQHLATYPAWSPDGRWLYYCRAPVLWKDPDAVPPEHYAEVKYSLMRIPYDIETDQWGAPKVVLSAEKTGLSILLPRISPDGRFLLFCMCRYGCFPVYQPTSDLYMMDLVKGTYEKCAINSEFSESYHSWSSNSRWVAFSSKRVGGVFTRSYLSYVDESGRMHKPFVVPQRDPRFYDSFLKTMSVPELVTGPVPVSAAAMERAARSGEAVTVETPSEDATRVESTEPYPGADGTPR